MTRNGLPPPATNWNKQGGPLAIASGRAPDGGRLIDHDQHRSVLGLQLGEQLAELGLGVGEAPLVHPVDQADVVVLAQAAALALASGVQPQPVAQPGP